MDTAHASLRRTWPLVAAILWASGCTEREPQQECTVEDTEVPADFMTPWGTVLERDLAQLVGPYHGTLIWHAGGQVLTVPKAGTEVEVDARIDIDAATATMREHQRGISLCQTDYLTVEGVVTFTRTDDGEAELVAPLTVIRDTDSPLYYAEAEISPIEDFDAELIPQQNFEAQSVSASALWGTTGWFLAEFRYRGHTADSPTTGQAASKLITEFTMPH